MAWASPKAPDHVAEALGGGVEHLDGDHASEPQILGGVDDAHAALSDDALHAVLSEEGRAQVRVTVRHARDHITSGALCSPR